MGTTVEDIRRWIDRKPKGTLWMIVATDTFDYTDYPIYVNDAEERDKKLAEISNPNKLSKVMEVYSFTGKHRIEDQLVTRRAWNLD